jgi:hypothetical protein
MFSSIVGTFDWPTAAMVMGVASSLAAGFGLWVNRTPVKLKEMKIMSDREIGLAQIERNRQVEMAKIDQKLITSHRAED